MNKSNVKYCIKHIDSDGNERISKKFYDTREEAEHQKTILDDLFPFEKHEIIEAF